MATPGFGFSAGDFISAAELIVKVGKALKDAGGAADDYRSVVAELRLLQRVLSQFQSAQSQARVDGAPFAQDQASITLATLSDFLSLISKFERKLGAQGPEEWYRGAGRKAQWAVVYAKKVEELRVRLGTQLQTLAVLLQLQESPEEILEKLDLVLSASQNQCDAISRLTTSQSQALDSIRETVGSLNLSSEITALGNSQSSHCRDITTRLDRFHGDFGRAHVEILDAVSRLDSTARASQGSGVQRRQPEGPASVASRRPRPRPQLQGDGTNTAPPDSAGERSGQVVPCNQQEDNVATLMLKLLAAISREMKELAFGAWLLLPHFMAFIRAVHITLRREPMLRASDCINLEDILGRRYMLQYSFFKHWEASGVPIKYLVWHTATTFEAFLLREFRGQPGEAYIRKRSYGFVDDSGILVRPMDDLNTWSIPARGPVIAWLPGSQVYMSALLLRLPRQAWLELSIFPCRRPGCGGKMKQDTSCSERHICSMCGSSRYRVTKQAIDRMVLLSGSGIGTSEISEDGDEKVFRRVHAVNLERSWLTSWVWYCHLCGVGPQTTSVNPRCYNCWHERCGGCAEESVSAMQGTARRQHYHVQ